MSVHGSHSGEHGGRQAGKVLEQQGELTPDTQAAGVREKGEGGEPIWAETACALSTCGLFLSFLVTTFCCTKTAHSMSMTLDIKLNPQESESIQ